MKNKAIIMIIILFINGCTQKLLTDFDYRIDLSKEELKILKKYIKKYGDLNSQIYIKSNYLYSNNMNLLKKIKIRLEGITPKYNRFPFIVNYDSNNYYIHNHNYKNLKINWLDDNDIYNYVKEKSKVKYGISVIKMDIPIEMLNLSKEDFINKYLVKEKDNIYFITEKDKLLFDIILLCQTKYEMIINADEEGFRVIDIEIEKVNDR